ncbi:phosphoglyceromutase [Prevotella sp. oral taxon 376]|uniref:phosphoglyceromutase n=1 Tax=Prevotella sp. oral taxon 376 TaxID=712466 RepID=UPI000D1F8655|nr:phosphoglyceromutase [Prevotella sp. oral taxon 376]PTL33425.1 phosphoglyceromutase [Prevotella sp. oral taxon 376]
MKKYFLAFLFIALCLPGIAKRKGTNQVVVVMVDGLRWQEIFMGADSALLNNKKFVSDIKLNNERFWRATSEERRAALLPFVWNYVAEHGIIYGNRTKESRMNVANGMHFSYPGYNETLAGYPDDARVYSNDAFPNPNVTVFEAANRAAWYHNSVYCFGTWDRFHEIFNMQRSGIPVNAGWDVSKNPAKTQAEEYYDLMEQEIPHPWGDVRYDAFTYRYALECMKTVHPRLIFVGFGETDNFAHEGRYGRYLDSAQRFDFFLKGLWDYCQSDPFYRDKTTFVVTVDHGRGSENWEHHGDKLPGSDETWFMAFGNGVKPKGEVSGGEQLYNKQVAFTIAELLDLDFKNTEGKTEKAIPLK